MAKKETVRSQTTTTTGSKFIKSDLIRKLKVRPRTITFKKADGTRRVMDCTLVEDQVPTVDGPLGSDRRGVLTVWEMKKKGWRSITVANILKVEDMK